MTQSYEESISVEFNVIGLVLGRGRCNLSTIEEKYNISISLEKTGSNNYLVVRASSHLNLALAIKELNYLIYDKTEFYKALQAKKKRYEEKYVENRLRQKENEIRKRYILGSVEDVPKKDKEINIDKGLKKNPFSVLQICDPDELEPCVEENEKIESEIEYDIIDQSDIPPHSPTLRAIMEEFISDSESESIICQKCIDEGRTSCPCD